MNCRKRRGRGEGAIFQRADGQWTGSISLGYADTGRRNRRTVYGPTKRAVQDELDRLRNEARVGILPSAGAMTVGQLLDRYLATSKSNDAPRTHEERERTIKNYLRPRLGGLKLSKFNALHVEGLYTDLQRDGVKPWALRHAADLLSIVLNGAVRKKLIAINPAKRVDKPKTPTREMLFLDDEQVKILFAAAKNVPVYPLLVVAVGTGMRQGELLALSWDDVDLRQKTVAVRKSLSQTKAGYVVKEPKTRTSRRTVNLPDVTVEALAAHKAAMMKKGLLAGPVFATRSGGYLCKKNVLRAFRAVVMRVNRPKDDGSAAHEVIPAKLRFHDLRHTHASLLLSKGSSVVAVSRRLGHSKAAITLNLYAHAMPNDDATLAAEINRLIA